MKTLSSFAGISWKGIHGRSWKTFFLDLYKEINEDFVFNGAAALAYYLLLAIFPAMIFLLSLLPYLPIPDLEGEIMGALGDFLPGDAANMFTGTVNQIVGQTREGLLSLGAVFTLWAASAGMYAVMQQLNITYDVHERRPFWKARGTSILLTVGFGALLITAFGLIMAGQALQDWLLAGVANRELVGILAESVRWLLVASALALGFAVIYYFGPDVEQDFRFITPGSVMGGIVFIGASVGFRFYVENFGSYNATYGSIGAIIVLMLWLYISGLVILLGSEVNALIEHYNPEGKDKGEKQMGQKPGRVAAAAS
jgi:membrane protein